MMNDLLPKLTFGFLMAQLFPGSVAILSITAPLQATKCGPADGIKDVFQKAEHIWFNTPTSIVFFVFLAAATGMLLHGLHWTTLAWLENRTGAKPQGASTLWWHRQRIFVQLLIAPFTMVIELMWTLSAPNIKRLHMEENLPHYSKDLLPAQSFLQEFYLFFDQFYAHTAYALLIAVPCSVWLWSQLSWTKERVLALLAVYLACGTCFIIGRAQLGTLFGAEEAIRNRSATAISDAAQQGKSTESEIRRN